MNYDSTNTDTIVISTAPVNDSNSETPELDSLKAKPQQRYKFIRSIGFGGMKGVLLVHDAETDREVAMAIMPDFRERPKADLERFVHEAKLTAKLEHPGIVPVHDIGIDQSGSPYFTMKYLRGIAFDHLLGKIRAQDPTVEKYTLDRLLMVFLRVCNAVDFAHSRKVCHLDLKPANINIGDFGEVHVLDWGLAQETDRFGQVISSSAYNHRGTPGFIAPECINSETPMGKRADIYALGALLYSILTLKTPLSGLPAAEALKRCMAGDIPRPGEVAPKWRHVPAALEAIAMKAMAVNANNRYNSVAELKAEIRAFTSGFASQAENASLWRKSLLFLRRNFPAVIIVLLATTTLYFAAKYYKIF